jgi:beta-barrel assembly-enhancing protease
MKAHFAIPIAAALMAAAIADANPLRPSRTDQVRLGQQAANEIRRKERVLPSTDARVRTLRRVGSELLRNTDDRGAPWQYSFDVIDNRQLNAFALPGGPVFFYTGLMDRIQTEDQLAGILAHEIAHVRQEHWASAYARQQERQLLGSLIFMIARPNRTIANIASIGADLVLALPYSRGNEVDADMVGLDMMVRAGYNPRGMADVFEMLRREARGGRTPEFLSTHPDDAGRIRRIEDRIAQMNRTFSPQQPIDYRR